MRVTNRFQNYADMYRQRQAAEKQKEEKMTGKKKDTVQDTENEAPQLALDQAFKKTRSGLQIYVEKVGKGQKIQTGSQLQVHYEGWLAQDFTLFDSSRLKGRPFEYTHGEGMVIDGWEEALVEVRQGAKLQLKIPAKLAYGEFGMPQGGIPANADLIFKVEVVKVKNQLTPSKSGRYA